MFYDEKFNDAVRKILEYNNKLTKLYQEGKINETTFRKKKKLVYEKLSFIKNRNVELIQKNIKTLEENRIKLKEQNEKGLVGGIDYESNLADLDQKKIEFDTEKNLIELCDNEDYMTYLKDQVEYYDIRKATEKYDSLGSGGRVFQKTGEQWKVPMWASISAFLMVLLVWFLSMLSGSLVITLIVVSILIIGLALSTIILHFCTTFVGIENATLGRAFTCVMANILINIVVNILLAILSIFILLFGSLVGLIGVISLMSIIRILIAFVISIAIVKHFYDTTWGKATVAVVLQIIIGVVIGFVLSFVFGLGILSLLRG